MDEQTKKELEKFIDISAKSQRNGNLPLIILEKGAKEPTASTWSALNSNLVYFALENDKAEYSLAEKIIEAQNNKKRLVVSMKKDLSSASINLISKMLNFGKIDMGGKEVDVVPGTIIGLVDRDFAEKNISYDNFYNLFSSAFSIKK